MKRLRVISRRKPSGFNLQRGVEQQFGVIQTQAGLVIFVNDFGEDSLGIERPLAPVLIQQPLAEYQAEIDGGQAKLGGDPFKPVGFAGLRFTSKDGQFVVRH